MNKLNVAFRDDYLNKRNNKAINYNDPDISEKRKVTESLPNIKEKRKRIALEREADPIKKANRLNKAFSKEAIDKRKKSLAITNQLPEVHKKRSNASKKINSKPEILEANKIRYLGVTWEERIGNIKAAEYKAKMSALKKEWHRNNPYRGERTGLNSPCADQTLYVWEHIHTGIREVLTRVEFCTKYKINNQNLQRILNNKGKINARGKPYSIQGWRLLDQ